MKRLLKWLLIVVLMVAVVMAFAILVWPGKNRLLSYLLVPEELPPAITQLPAERVEKVEKVLDLVRSVPQGDNPTPESSGEPQLNAAPESKPLTQRLTEDEINRQVKYELSRRGAADRGIEGLFVQLATGKITVSCMLDGKKLFHQLPLDSQGLFPALLRNRGLLVVEMTPHQDVVDRLWVRLESVHLGRLSIPLSVLLPLLKKNLRGVEYDAEDGFLVPGNIRRLESGDHWVDVELSQ